MGEVREEETRKEGRRIKLVFRLRELYSHMAWRPQYPSNSELVGFWSCYEERLAKILCPLEIISARHFPILFCGPLNGWTEHANSERLVAPSMHMILVSYWNKRWEKARAKGWHSILSLVFLTPEISRVVVSPFVFSVNTSNTYECKYESSLLFKLYKFT